MTQTRLESLVEACTNTVIGFGVALLSQIVIFPQYGVHVEMSTHIGITLWFTAVSVARGYILRRWFNAHIGAINSAIVTAIGRIKTNDKGDKQ